MIQKYLEDDQNKREKFAKEKFEEINEIDLKLSE